LTRRFGVTIDCRRPTALAQFWCEILGYVSDPPPDGFHSWAEYDAANGISAAEADSGCTIIDPAGALPRLYFQRVPEPKTGKNRVHLDVVASEHHRWADVMAAADRAVELGGALVRESDDPNDRFVTLTDPEGNEFCLVARNAGAGAANEL
jgi:hypothetical protein